MWRATPARSSSGEVRDGLAEQVLRENGLRPALRPVRLARARGP